MSGQLEDILDRSSASKETRLGSAQSASTPPIRMLSSSATKSPLREMDTQLDRFRQDVRGNMGEAISNFHQAVHDLNQGRNKDSQRQMRGDTSRKDSTAVFKLAKSPDFLELLKHRQSRVLKRHLHHIGRLNQQIMEIHKKCQEQGYMVS
jgi:hypothetical protein